MKYANVLNEWCYNRPGELKKRKLLREVGGGGLLKQGNRNVKTGPEKLEPGQLGGKLQNTQNNRAAHWLLKTDPLWIIWIACSFVLLCMPRMGVGGTLPGLPVPEIESPWVKMRRSGWVGFSFFCAKLIIPVFLRKIDHFPSCLKANEGTLHFLLTT